MITHLRLLIDRARHVGRAAEDHHQPLIRLVIERAEVATARRAEQRHLSRFAASWAQEQTKKILGAVGHTSGSLAAFGLRLGAAGTKSQNLPGNAPRGCTTRAETGIGVIRIAWRSYLS